MDKKRTLFDVGFAASAAPKRHTAVADASHVESDTDVSVVEPEQPRIPNHLSEKKVLDRQHDYPWAVYVGPSNYNAKGNPVHEWRCDYCEKNTGQIITYKFKDASEFSRHASQEKHKAAAQAISLRSRMQTAREDNAIQYANSIVSQSGRLLVMVAFMIANGISLKLFPQV
jgi:hypothetical protein